MHLNFEKINFALENSGLKKITNKGQASYLGEGAWHHAYLITTQEDGKLVIRFPKEIAYGSKVEYNEKAIHAEYGGTKLYYKKVNEVEPGFCPEFFDYHVEQGNTYTIETYKGKNLKLANISIKDAFHIGHKIGQVYKKMHDINHNLKGFGYLTWNGETVEGQVTSDVSMSMKEENEMYASEFDELCQFEERFTELKVKFRECLASRKIDNETIAFTNQDTSPENVLFSDGQVSIIDPYPILYYGHSFAGNFLNNYIALFPTFYNAPRYEKHQFDKYERELVEIANGFLNGYAEGDKQIEKLVKKEQFIQLANLTFEHYKAYTGELSKRELIAYGTKDAIKARIPVFLNMLKEIEI